MIDNLGFHDDRDLTTELAKLQREYDATLARCTTNAFHSPETSWNTWGRLDSLRNQLSVTTREAAMENQRLQRLADGVRLVGDIELGFIAYVVFGPAALPIEPLHEVRLIDEDGYTVHGTVRTNLPAERVARATVKAHRIGARYEREMGRTATGCRIQVTAF